MGSLIAGVVRAAVLGTGAIVGTAACGWLVGHALTVAQTPAWNGWQAPLSTATPRPDPSPSDGAGRGAAAAETASPTVTPSAPETPGDGWGATAVPTGDSSAGGPAGLTTLPDGATAGGVLGQAGEDPGQLDDRQLRLLLGEGAGAAQGGDLPTAAAATPDPALSPAPVAPTTEVPASS